MFLLNMTSEKRIISSGSPNKCANITVAVESFPPDQLQIYFKDYVRIHNHYLSTTLRMYSSPKGFGILLFAIRYHNMVMTSPISFSVFLQSEWLYATY